MGLITKCRAPKRGGGGLLERGLITKSDKQTDDLLERGVMVIMKVSKESEKCVTLLWCILNSEILISRVTEMFFVWLLRPNVLKILFKAENFEFITLNLSTKPRDMKLEKDWLTSFNKWQVALLFSTTLNVYRHVAWFPHGSTFVLHQSQHLLLNKCCTVCKWLYIRTRFMILN